MGFGAAFGGGFRPLFDPGGAPWWLAGGVAPSACIAAYQSMGAASQAISYTNLANPGTYNAAPGTAPTWDAQNGWKFSAASSQYLTTGITPPSGTNTWTVLIQFSNVTSGSGARELFGSFNAAPTNRFYVRPYESGNVVRYGCGSPSVTVSPQLTSGNLGFAGLQPYRNGVADGSASSAGTGSQYPVLIGGAANEITPTDFISAYIQKFVIYNLTLTAAQMLAIATAMATL